MNYRLAVLTHGDNEELVDLALSAFHELVNPQPSALTIHHDSDPQLGFCGASAALWQKCVAGGEEYVFWLEHDFIVQRPVYLEELAAVLDDYQPPVSQVALMRDAYSVEEKEAGGLYELRQSDFEEMDGWLRSGWWTTNPSLIRRDFMIDHPFIDDGLAHCEGRYGIGLAELGYQFAVWGDGSVFVKHIGVRSGFGY